MLDWLNRRRMTRRCALALYGSIVSQARHPSFYTDVGIPDTPEGRFEMIAAHIVVVLQRLASEGDAGHRLGQALVEAFVGDMDDNVREMGIGDTGVARRVKKAAAALYDRHRAYGPALADDDRPRLATALALAIWGGETHRTAAAEVLAATLLAAARVIAGQPGPDLLAGRVMFSPLPVAS